MKKRYLSTIFLSTLICAFLQSPVRAHWLPTTLTGAVTVMAGYAARRSYKVMKEAERTLKAKKDDLWAQTVHKNARAMFHKSMAAGGVAGIATIFLALRKKTAPTDPNTTDATTLTRKTRRLAEAYAGPKADIICTDDVTAFRQDLEAMLIMNPQTSKADECTAALPFAVQTGSTEIIDFCMQNGADINHRDPMSKKSMLEIALEKKNAPLVAIFLKQYGAIYDQQKLDAALPDLIIESIAADKLLTAS